LQLSGGRHHCRDRVANLGPFYTERERERDYNKNANAAFALDLNELSFILLANANAAEFLIEQFLVDDRETDKTKAICHTIFDLWV
jgi:hypothetical protein